LAIDNSEFTRAGLRSNPESQGANLFDVWVNYGMLLALYEREKN
jgi:hypothetical protein